MATVQGRRYGGADADERRLRRREAFVVAGLDLFGSEDFDAVSIKRLCDHAGLTQRYFYESFSDRAGALGAVYEDCVQFARAATIAAASPFIDTSSGTVGQNGVADADVPAAARAILGAFIDCLASDPRRSRVMLVEVVGVSAELERQRLQAIHGWADLILTFARGTRPSSRVQRLAAVGLVGAVTQLLVDWYTATTAPIDASSGPDDFDLEAIREVCVELFVATHARLEW
ncbi:TetR/AcrR family transcriptional regulator [Gordonia soli]|uniref:Putative TetR family transcriptional regulator n=1 Tax=Gordonia soli NBRC 108243 TaxID=1223545 RepID=M0QH80_9ACTN|nr:TetR/AcrR family transcriptional regulator [Gordonia soli]GAC66782.1 putative TetR family transcriptional regulator [Gordonia soli NBRC 108243]